MFARGMTVLPASAFRSKKSYIKTSGFKEWKHVVASIVYFHIGKNVDELVDHDYYNIYMRGMPACVMADMVLRRNGY